MLTNVPFARHQRPIAGGPKYLCDRGATIVEVSLIRRFAKVFDHQTYTGLMGIQSS